MKTKTKRTHRGRTTYKLLTLGVLGMLVATVGVNAAKNLQTFATDVPSWGNDGMGIIFTDNYIKDENGNVSKQSSTASFGETVDYSVKLNAKQYFGGNTAAAYVANIDFDSSLSFDESSLQIKVGGVTVDPGELGDTYYYAYEKDENTGVGELAVAIRYVDDFTAQGQCVPFAPATNVREGAAYWLAQKAKRPTCSEGSLFEESGYFTNIVSDRQDAEIEISFSAKYDMAPSKEDNIGTVTASYDYIYFDPSNEIKRAEDVDETTATVQSGNLLIRKTDPDGNPLKGAKFTIDNLRAKNMGGIYYPEEEGMHKFFTSNDFGEILIKGVRLGDYTVREIEAPEGYEVAANPFTVTVSPETTKQLTYKHVKMSSATFSATDADMSTAVTMFPNGELAMINGDVATFYWDENQGKYIFSNDATGYIIKDMDGSLHMIIRDMQISYEPTGEDGEYRQEGASLLFNVHEENGLMRDEKHRGAVTILNSSEDHKMIELSERLLQQNDQEVQND